MKPKYYLKQLRDAFLYDDYEAQTEIAKKLLDYEESGTITNEMVMDAVNTGLNLRSTVYRNILVHIESGEMSEKELTATVDQIIADNPDKIFKSITLTVDGDELIVKYVYDSVEFHRIRRITGYLVGTLDRFGDAKRAEERDRVKHSLT